MFTSAQKEAILQKELCLQTGGKHTSSPSGDTLNKFLCIINGMEILYT
jgi:hypothetical protein